MASDHSAIFAREGLDVPTAARNAAAGFVIRAGKDHNEKRAFFGVGTGEPSVVAMQERVFMRGAAVGRSPDRLSVHPSPAFANVALALHRAPVGHRTGA